MPYVNFIREGGTPEQKAAFVRGFADLLVETLDKNSVTTVEIDKVSTKDWGIGGVPVDRYRPVSAAGASR